jgi:hypothetical protein
MSKGVWRDGFLQGSENHMTMTKIGLTAMLLATLVLGACAPLVIGGAVAVVADEAIEQDKGGDGLF